MAKSLTEQIAQQLTELQQENSKLKEYEKIFEKLLKIEFNLSKKDIEKVIQSQAKNDHDFERRICSFFALNSDAEKEAFLTAICTENGAEFYRRNRRISNGEIHTPQQG